MDPKVLSQLATVIVNTHTKLPLIDKDVASVEWGSGDYRISLAKDPKSRIMLYFHYSGMEGFEARYETADESYGQLDKILAAMPAPRAPQPSDVQIMKKVMAVLVFYVSGMKRVKDLGT